MEVQLQRAFLPMVILGPQGISGQQYSNKDHNTFVDLCPSTFYLNVLQCPCA